MSLVDKGDGIAPAPVLGAPWADARYAVRIVRSTRNASTAAISPPARIAS
jgi:hypothetical protein